MKALIWPGIAIATLVVSAWLFRWEMISYPSEGRPRIFMLDRWAGQLHFVGSEGLIKVESAVKP